MLDNELYQILIPIIQNGLNAQGFSNIPVVQLNQPTQQGVNTESTVYLTKLSDERLGFVRNNSEWDEIDQKEIETDSQIIVSNFQASALVIQNPEVISYTASDLLNYVALILNSFATVRALAQNNLGILRIAPIQNPYFSDDKDRFEAMPSFDFGITHRREIIQQTDIISDIIVNLYPLEG